MTAEPTLFHAQASQHGLCRYGYPNQLGKCLRPATHRAVWRKQAAGVEQDGGLECCRDHANYYATAWAPYCLKVGAPGSGHIDEAVWIDILAWEGPA